MVTHTHIYTYYICVCSIYVCTHIENLTPGIPCSQFETISSNHFIELPTGNFVFLAQEKEDGALCPVDHQWGPRPFSLHCLWISAVTPSLSEWSTPPGVGLDWGGVLAGGPSPKQSTKKKPQLCPCLKATLEEWKHAGLPHDAARRAGAAGEGLVNAH